MPNAYLTDVDRTLNAFSTHVNFDKTLLQRVQRMFKLFNTHSTDGFYTVKLVCYHNV